MIYLVNAANQARRRELNSR
jgi:hypothetical protein